MKRDIKSLAFLDGLRGLAALYVVMGHARWLLWEGGESFRAHMSNYSFFHKAFVVLMSMFKYGHEMVLFFFVLSGFVIHLKFSLNINENRDADFDFKTYFMRRAKRILPPYLFALLLTFILDSIVAANGYSIFQHITPDKLINQNVQFDHSLTTIVGNLFFLQNAYVPVFGTNGPLWSLKYEWWFYMTYPILYFFNKKSVWATIIVIAFLACLRAAGLETSFTLLDQVAGYLFSWWLGAIAADLYTGRITISKFLIYPFCLIISLIPYINTINLSSLLKDNLIALGFFSLLILMLNNVNSVLLNKVKKLKFLGDCSYTLYVIHFPILVLINGILLKTTENVLPSSFFYMFIGVLISIGFSYLIHFTVEKPFTSKFEKKKRSITN